jgi:hypothetical protein
VLVFRCHPPSDPGRGLAEDGLRRDRRQLRRKISHDRWWRGYVRDTTGRRLALRAAAVSKFRFGQADGSDQRLQIALAAQVVLVEGIPAGAAVEGLVVEWAPGSGIAPDVRFEGISLAFAVPGSFRAALSIAYREEAGIVEFRGSGTIELPALDAMLDVSVVVAQKDSIPEPFVYLYLFADANLLPTGIPIGSTGLTIYGFQGPIAYQMRLDLDEALPPDERFYALFMRDPVGTTAGTKWIPERSQNVLGAGIVAGTPDKGFAINTKERTMSP